MQFVDKYIKGDRAIWIIMLLLAVLSLLVVYSSVVTLAYKYRDGNAFSYLFKHLVILVLGFGIAFLAQKVKYTYYNRISQISLYITVPLLLLTLLTGANLNEASRWLMIPVINQTFQTSDFAKLALIMYLARILSKKEVQEAGFRMILTHVVFPILMVVLLILPANFSTAAMLLVTSVVVMFIGGVKVRYILTLVGIGVVSLGILFFVARTTPNLLPRLDTWVKRVESYSSGDSEVNYQAEQSKIAIATGGVVGNGPGKSNQRNFLPHPYSDFIYAIVVEEYGMVGGVIVAFLYLVLLYRGVRIALKAKKNFGSLLAIGLTFSLVFQALINMAVAVNLLPVTGQPLPLVSMGGTSIWFTCLALGVVLSVSNGLMKPAVNKIKNG